MKHGKKNVKSHVFLDFEKRKNVEVISYRSIGLKTTTYVHRRIFTEEPKKNHGDHPQSVLLSFTQLSMYVGPILINNEQF